MPYFIPTPPETITMSSPFITAHNVLHCYVNGWLSHGAAKSALKALGFPADEAEEMLRASWDKAS
jgi:hypothetical protein